MSQPCPYQSKPTGRDVGLRICSLGLFGGDPYVGNCIACIKAGENTPEKAQALRDRAYTSHPSTAPRISGCCDSARNYPST